MTFSIYEYIVDIVRMAGFQKIIVSFLLLLSITFMFLAQGSEAAKGPKITHKVRTGTAAIDALVMER